MLIAAKRRWRFPNREVIRKESSPSSMLMVSPFLFVLVGCFFLNVPLCFCADQEFHLQVEQVSDQEPDTMVKVTLIYSGTRPIEYCSAHPFYSIDVQGPKQWLRPYGGAFSGVVLNRVLNPGQTLEATFDLKHKFESIPAGRATLRFIWYVMPPLPEEYGQNHAEPPIPIASPEATLDITISTAWRWPHLPASALEDVADTAAVPKEEGNTQPSSDTAPDDAHPSPGPVPLPDFPAGERTAAARETPDTNAPETPSRPTSPAQRREATDWLLPFAGLIGLALIVVATALVVRRLRTRV